MDCSQQRSANQSLDLLESCRPLSQELTGLMRCKYVACRTGAEVEVEKNKAVKLKNISSIFFLACRFCLFEQSWTAANCVLRYKTKQTIPPKRQSGHYSRHEKESTLKFAANISREGVPMN